MSTTSRLLDAVGLTRGHVEHGLCKGELGTVVELWGDTSLEVEIVRFSGLTQALVALDPWDQRPLGDGDLRAVRSGG